MKTLQPRKVNKPLILYGYGNLGHLAEEIFKELNIPILKILDKKIQYAGVKKEWKATCLVAHCCVIEPYFSHIKVRSKTRHRRILPISMRLRELGWMDVVPVWDIIEAYPEANIHNGFFSGEYSKEDQKTVRIVAQHFFADHLSKIHYHYFLTWKKMRIEESLWVHKPLLNLRYKIPEVLAAIRIRDRYFSEHPGSTLADLRKRQYVHVFNKPYNYIELHAEGYELQSLEANKEYLQEHRPILCITTYHSRDGLWKIPMFVYENLKDYSLLFRVHAYQGQAAVLYCIPSERR
ncbi:MAG: hypothetical protein WC364_14390 [Eubacteriales bacterium]|jgi:hypothetical protein